MHQRIDSSLLVHIENEFFLKKLYYFALRKLNAYSGLAIDMTAEDLVHEAIKLTCEGRRKWDKEKYPDPFPHLAGCIRSIIYNQVNKIEIQNRNFNYNIEETKDEKLIEFIIDIQDISQSFTSLVKKKAPDLYPVIVATLEKDITKRQELAEYLNITQSEVDNKRARLKRLYKKHYKEA